MTYVDSSANMKLEPGNKYANALELQQNSGILVS